VIHELRPSKGRFYY